MPRFRLDHVYCNVLRAGAKLGGLHGGRSLGGLGTHFYDYSAAGAFSRGRYSHSDSALYILYGKSLMKYTG
jgi:hypothetical protein